jgi:VWFA-related protein
VALSLLMLAAGPGAVPQSANPPEIQGHETTPKFRIRAERNLVIVRVVVRDAKERTVGDLHKEDFRLLDDGKPQEIAGFSVEAANPQTAATQARLTPAATTGTSTPTLPPPATAAPQRFVALFFDDQHSKVEGIARTRDAAWRYVSTTVRPQDRVAVLTATGKDHLDFTNDRGKLHEALFRLVPRAHSSNACPEIDDYEAYLVDKMHAPEALAVLHTEALRCDCLFTSDKTDVTTERPAMAYPEAASGDPCTVPAMRRAEFEAANVWSEAEMHSQFSLQAIEESVRHLAAMPGQRSLVLVSPGFLTQTQGDKIDAIINRALQQDVVISAIDAVGLEARVPHEITNAGRPDMEARKTMLVNAGVVASGDVLASLSAGTGGVFFHNSNDFDDGFRQVAAVPEVSYVLSFSPQNVKLNGKFHSLKVTLNTHESFTVQARRGYFASETALAGQASSADELQKVVFSLEERHELPAEVSTKVEKLNDQKSTLTVYIHVDIASLGYRKEADRSVNTLIFDTGLFDRDGKYVTGKEGSLELHLKDGTLEKFSKSGIYAKSSFEVGPGTYRVREVVRDSESTGMSALNCEVQVPGSSR